MAGALGAFADLPSNDDAEAAKKTLPLINELERSGTAAQRQGVPVDQVVSPAGAIGQYQVMPSTGALYGFGEDQLRTAAGNQDAATAYLKDMAARFGDDPALMAAAYNGGPGRAAAIARGDTASVPAETQDYYGRAVKLLAQGAGAVGDAIIPPARADEANPFSDLPPAAKAGANPFADLPEAQPSLVQRGEKAAGSALDYVKGMFSGDGPLPVKGKPQGSWFDTMKSAAADIVPGLEKTAGGLVERLGTPTTGDLNAVPGGASIYDEMALFKGQTPPSDVVRAAAEAAPKTPGTVAYSGRQIAKAAQQHIAENAPNIPENSAKQWALDITNGVVQMAPLIVASAVTKSSAPLLGGFAVQGYGDRYAESRQAGRDPDQADADAMFSSLANTLPAELPLHALMKPGQSFLGKVMHTMGAAGLQSAITTALQTAYDKGILNKDMTWGDAAQAVVRSGLVGTGIGAVLGIGGGAAGRIKSQGETPAAVAAPKVEPSFGAAPDGAQNAQIGAQSVAPAPKPPVQAVTAPAAGLEPVHDPVTWAQVGWKDAGGNVLPLDAGRAGTAPPALEGPGAPAPDLVQHVDQSFKARMAAKFPGDPRWTGPDPSKTAVLVADAIATGKYNDALHPSNPNARDTFQDLTGVALPRGVKATQQLFQGQPFPVRPNPASAPGAAGEGGSEAPGPVFKPGPAQIATEHQAEVSSLKQQGTKAAEAKAKLPTVDSLANDLADTFLAKPNNHKEAQAAFDAIRGVREGKGGALTDFGQQVRDAFTAKLQERGGAAAAASAPAKPGKKPTVPAEVENPPVAKPGSAAPASAVPVEASEDRAEAAAAAKARGYDFEKTFPQPQDAELRKAGRPGFFDEAGVGDKTEQLKSFHQEAENHLSAAIAGLDAADKAIETGIDPQTGKPPNPGKLADFQKKWQEVRSSSVQDFEDHLASYQDYFGHGAADDFRAHVLDRHDETGAMAEALAPPAKPVPAKTGPSPDQARAALKTNIDPRTGERPKGNAALRQFRAEMEAAATAENVSHETQPEVAKAVGGDAALANSIEAHLALGETLDQKGFAKLADLAFGGTAGEGAWDARRAYDAMETGVNRYIARSEAFDPRLDSAGQAKANIRELKALEDRLPLQSRRTGDTDAFQQFSTPPAYGYAAAWAANLRPGDVMLEPSAGNGGLATFAKKAGAKVIANEIGEVRRANLERQDFDQVTGHDAEQINNLLPDKLKPNVVLMNPPFSNAAQRGGVKDSNITGRHIDQALKKLEPGGRLVAITGGNFVEGNSRNRPFFQRWGRENQIRASVGVDGKVFHRYGTSYPTRVIVIDKVAPDGRPVVTGNAETPEALIDLLKEVRDDRPESQGTAATGEGRDAAAKPPSREPEGESVIPPKELQQTLKNLGATGQTITLPAKDAFQRVVKEGDTATLANGWTLSRRSVAGEKRMKLSGPNPYTNRDAMERAGVQFERIGYEGMFFVPDNERGHRWLDTQLKQSPIVSFGDDQEAPSYARRDQSEEAPGEPSPPFFSALTHAVEAMKQEKATPEQWAGAIRNAPGVKDEERDWSGVADWLGQQKGQVSRSDLLQHLRENEVQVKEVERGAGADDDTIMDHHEISSRFWNNLTDRERGELRQQYAKETGNRVAAGTPAKFSSYTIRGGDNYRELLLTLPAKDTVRREPSKAPAGWGDTNGGDTGFVERGDNRQDFRSGHFDEPNVIAHIRFDDRTGPNGEKVLHIAEVQSDWHQAGRRKGYQSELEAAKAKADAELAAMKPSDPDYLAAGQRAIDAAHAAKNGSGVPDAPFKTSWHELAMKRMLRYAAEHGYDRVSWDTGETQADRYDLSHQINRIEYEPTGDGAFEVDVFGKDGKSIDTFRGKEFTPEQIEENFGKDIAKKMADGIGRDLKAERPLRDWKSLEGLDLKVGGDGMKGFYDKILPASVNKLAKKWGTKVEPSTIGTAVDHRTYNGRTPSHEQILAVAEAIHAKPTDRRFVSPITGERQEYQINRVANESAWRDVIKETERGKTFADAMAEHGNSDLFRIFGAEEGARRETGGQPAHSIAITPAMSEGVMRGQPLFNRGKAFSAAGAVADHGFETKSTPAFAEARDRLWPELRKRMDALGLKDVALRLPDRISTDAGDADGVFWRNTIQLALDSEKDPAHTLDHEMIHALERKGLIDEKEMQVLGAKARQDWVDRYRIAKRYGDFEPERQTEEAIAHAFADWRAGKLTGHGNAVQRIFQKIAKFFEAMRNALHGLGFKTSDDVFARIGGGGGDAGPDRGPAFARRAPEDRDETPEPRRTVTGRIDHIIGEASDAVAKRIRQAGAKIFPQSIKDAAAAVQLAVTPMAHGSDEARAGAKDFANAMRKARVITGRQVEYLQKTFKPEQLAKMWEAADEQSVALQEGRSVEGIGLSKLSPAERKAVETYQLDSNVLLRQAQDIGLFKGEGLPSYVPRMVVAMGSDGRFGRLQSGGGERPHALDAIGRNLKTTSPNLRHRKYLTAEETEAAAQALDPGAMVVKDFRTLPLAMGRLQEAIAGRTLIDRIKAMGQDSGDLTVSEGAIPNSTDKGGWFTIDHPAFKTYRPKFVKNGETGKVEVMTDQNDNELFERVPIYVRKDFEGPLRAVLSTDTGGIYRAAMDLKGKTMSVIMYSPLMHNAVIWGKAFPSAPLKLVNPLWRDGQGTWHFSIELYGRGRALKNDPAAMKEALDNGVDPIGHRYFNQDISAMLEEPNLRPGRSWTAKLIGGVPGLFDPKAGDAVKRAIDRAGDIWHNKLLWDLVGDLQMGLYQHLKDSAVRAGHDEQTAGRYAAHFANRYAGALPIESMSKIARQTANMLLFSRSFTLTNLGAFKDLVAGLPKDVQAQIMRDRGIEALKGIQGAAHRKAASLLAMDIFLSHAGLFLAQYAMAWALGHAFHPPGQNEPDREQRFLIGYQKDGTAIYGRLPTGKVGEELQDWVTEPVDVTKRKLSPFAQTAYGILSNDQGFGRKIYDPYDQSAWGYAKNIGRVAQYAAENVAPLSPFQALADLHKGHGDPDTNWLKIAAPMIGVTISKGAPGGPAIGQLYASKDENEFQIGEKMPDIRNKIANGDVKGAIKAMTGLGMTTSYQRFVIKTTEHPGSRLTAGQIREFMGYASPDEQEKMRLYLNEPKPAKSGSGTAPPGPEQHSGLEPSDLGGALRQGRVQQFADAGNTWTRQDAVRAATRAGMPATADILRHGPARVGPDLQNAAGLG